MRTAQILVSAVSDEFASYREALRADLEGPNVSVKVQEDFIATGTDTLDKLDVYVRECDAVIHLIGDMTGAMVQAPSVAAIGHRYPDLCRQFPFLADSMEAGGPTLPYTQWEAWLAIYHRRRLLIAAPTADAPRDHRRHAEPSERLLQQTHRARLAHAGRHPEILFSNSDRLAVKVLRSPLQEIIHAANPPLTLTPPGIGRTILDRCAPRLHDWLCQKGTLKPPPELNQLRGHLLATKALIYRDAKQAYVPIDARRLTTEAYEDVTTDDPFRNRVVMLVRQIIGVEQGGDSATAQIAALNKRTKPVRDIERAVMRARRPVVLLGDPGSGKTMTLQRAAVSLIDAELTRVFPHVTIYVRLGELSPDTPVSSASVFDALERRVRKTLPAGLKALDQARRLTILFDGMDEMSREDYRERVEALSRFATERSSGIRTLFSCRINDFNPAFEHERLVLLPFNASQIRELLEHLLPGRSVRVDGVHLSHRRLARRLLDRTLPFEPTNPFVLWLLCLHIRNVGTFPQSRVELLEQHVARNWERVFKNDPTLPKLTLEQATTVWAALAFLITARNGNVAMLVDEAAHSLGDDLPLDTAITIGRRCGVLAAAAADKQHWVRFEHHRMQEFFTSCHLRANHVDVDWADKLDAPRWQETLVNLALFGAAANALDVLAHSLRDDARAVEAFHLTQAEGSEDEEGFASKRRRMWLKMSPEARAEATRVERERRADAGRYNADTEARLSDRVEVASRLARDAGRANASVRDQLSDPIRQSARTLAKYGNPITQVKALQACHNVPTLGEYEPLQVALASNVRWVRQQALVILDNDPKAMPALGSSVADFIAADLASGSFFSRLPEYCKLAWVSGKARTWWALVAGVFCFLAMLAGLLAAALFSHKLAMSRLSVDGSAYIGSAWLAYSLIAVAISCGVIALRRDPANLWVGVLFAPLTTLAILIYGETVWKGRVNAVTGLLQIGMATFVIFLGTAAVAFGCVTLALLLFIALQGRKPSPGIRTLVESATRAGVLEGAWPMFGAAGGLVLAFGALAIAGAALYKLSTVTGLTLEDVLLGGGALVVALSVGLSAFLAATKREDAGTPLTFAALVLALGTFSWILSRTAPVIRAWVASLTVRVSPQILVASRVIVLTVGVAAVILLGVWLVRSGQTLVRMMTLRFRSTPIAADPHSWRERFTNATHDEQALLLKQITSLGLRDTSEYLALLEEVEAAVKPDSSEYWSQREKFIEMKRQERM